MKEEIRFNSFSEMTFYKHEKKVCPICGADLDEIRKKTNMGKQIVDGMFGGMTWGEIIKIEVSYYCPKCDKLRTLKEVYDLTKEKDNEQNKLKYTNVTLTWDDIPIINAIKRFLEKLLNLK